MDDVSLTDQVSFNPRPSAWGRWRCSVTVCFCFTFLFASRIETPVRPADPTHAWLGIECHRTGWPDAGVSVPSLIAASQGSFFRNFAGFTFNSSTQILQQT